MKTITLHHVTCTKAFSMYEQGSYWSLQPWGNNTDRYEGYSEPVEFECPDNLSLAMTTGGRELLFWDGDTSGHELYTDKIHKVPAVLKADGYTSHWFKRVKIAHANAN